jgi:hypothetical protein
MSAQRNDKAGLKLKHIAAVTGIAWIAMSFPLRLPPATWFQKSVNDAPQFTDTAPVTSSFPDKPPFRFGRRTLARVCEEYGIDAESIDRELAGFAITARSEWSIKRIAEENDMETAALFEVIREVSLDRGHQLDVGN